MKPGRLIRTYCYSENLLQTNTGGIARLTGKVTTTHLGLQKPHGDKQLMPLLSGCVHRRARDTLLTDAVDLIGDSDEGIHQAFSVGLTCLEALFIYS